LLNFKCIEKLKRFDFDADTVEGAVNYLKNRAIQFLSIGYKLSVIDKYEFGAIAYFKDSKDNIFQSIYITKPFRSKGLYKKYVTHTILTTQECGIEDYLLDNKIKYRMEDPLDGVRPEYYMIQKYYGDKKAERSGLYLMNHIDEGLAILEEIGASYYAKKAFCIHPLVQSDESLKEYFEYLQNIPVNADEPYQGALLLAMEYRSVANAYLSKREINSLDDIQLSVLKDVNDMLIADKVQNRKDFELFHLGKHERSNELDSYFKNWLRKLDISEERYEYLKSLL